MYVCMYQGKKERKKEHHGAVTASSFKRAWTERVQFSFLSFPVLSSKASFPSWSLEVVFGMADRILTRRFSDGLKT